MLSWRRAVDARWRGIRESERRRLLGRVVLVCGLTGTAVFYWTEARPAPRSLDELMPGYTRSETRQMGTLMGHTGVMMLEWQAALERPGTQALLLAGVVGLVGLGFFRAARLAEEDEHPGSTTSSPSPR